MSEEDGKEETTDPRSHFYEIADWFARSKKALSDKAEQRGEEEELIGSLGDNWPYMEPTMRGLDPQLVSDYTRQNRQSASLRAACST
jgi:hypothetical protein